MEPDGTFAQITDTQATLQLVSARLCPDCSGMSIPSLFQCKMSLKEGSVSNTR